MTRARGRVRRRAKPGEAKEPSIHERGSRSAKSALHRRSGEIAARVTAVAQRAREAPRLLEPLDDLGEKAQVLALNAAIEASRAGPDGAGPQALAEEAAVIARRVADMARDVESFLAGLAEAAEEALVCIVGPAARLTPSRTRSGARDSARRRRPAAGPEAAAARFTRARK